MYEYILHYFKSKFPETRILTSVFSGYSNDVLVMGPDDNHKYLMWHHRSTDEIRVAVTELTKEGLSWYAPNLSDPNILLDIESKIKKVISKYTK